MSNNSRKHDTTRLQREYNARRHDTAQVQRDATRVKCEYNRSTTRRNTRQHDKTRVRKLRQQK